MNLLRPELREGPVVLRGPKARDVADRVAIGRHAEYVRLVGGDDSDLSPLLGAEAQMWFEHVAAEAYYWVIDVEGRAVGTVRLHHVDVENRKAMYAVGIFDPAKWGMGYGTIATRLVLAFGFQTLRLHRIA